MGAPFGGVYEGRRVLVTGHTGFKGSWLTLWLAELGARVFGFSLEAPTDPNLFGVARISERLAGHVTGDIRDGAAVAEAMFECRPEVVLHLAAQPLVRESYADPVGTYATNVMGTVHVLEAVRACPSVRAVVIVTSDKCYENGEWEYAYRENDAMGGSDPYSSSKACAELVTAAYLRSFFTTDGLVGVASARAGNVVGGGDWARDRLVPDCVRALGRGEAIVVRNPGAVRPWQHVLEPLSGYLLLGARLLSSADVGGAWNFGPDADGTLAVRDVAESMIREWGSGSLDCAQRSQGQPHEATLLRLDSTKARTQLGWKPVWDIEETLVRTAAWYGDWHRDASSAEGLCLADIAAYVDAARAAGATWTGQPKGSM